jgi:hypothetical protein
MPDSITTAFAKIDIRSGNNERVTLQLDIVGTTRDL